MLLPQQIAEQLTPDEMMDVEHQVAEKWGQSYGIVRVIHKSKVVVEVELEDRTRHEIILKSSQNK